MQLVTLIGVPGIGKSRVVWELFRAIDAGDELVTWRRGRSLPYAEAISFWALGEIVKAETAILETDQVAEAGRKLARTVADVVQGTEAEWVERHVRPLVGIEPGTEMRGDHRGEAFAAWRTFIEGLADRRPMVLVFEDLHWADDGLLDFVDHLVDRATGVPLLIVATSRPELLSRRPNWAGGKPNALSISLGALSDTETSALVAGLVELSVIPDAVRRQVLDRAAGNPLYAEEFARLVAEQGSLDDLPESVQGIIAARLDTLAREEKELLQHAAVLGKVFWSRALARMTGRDFGSVEVQLHELERKQFVRRERRSSVAGEIEYAFSHILVRDVAYGQIPRGRRAERHVLAAEWMESLGRPADHAELLAQHYLSATQLARAAGRPVDSYAAPARLALREAGDRAVALNAFPAAARYFYAAHDLTPADDPVRPLLLFLYGKALRMAEVRGSDVLAEAEALLLAGGDSATAAEAAVLQGELAWDAGDGDLTAKHIYRAAAIVERLEPSFSKAYVLSDLSRYHMLRGDAEQAIAAGESAIAIAESLGLDEVLLHALNNVGSARWNNGDSRGIAEVERALAIADARNSIDTPRAMNNLASAVESTGDTKRARELWRGALDRARELGNVWMERHVRSIVVTLDYHEGNWDRALERLNEFVAEVEASGGHPGEAAVRTCRAHIRFARGDREGALDDAEQAVRAGRRSGYPHAITPAFGVMVWLLTEVERHDEAEALLDELVVYPTVGGSTGTATVLAMLRGEALTRFA